MVSKSPVHPSTVLPTSQGLQKGIIYGGKITKTSYSEEQILMAGKKMQEKEEKEEEESCFYWSNALKYSVMIYGAYSLHLDRRRYE